MIFIDNKYTKWYYSLIEKAKNRKLDKNIYSETHHIIPKSFYLTNKTGWLEENQDDLNNLVELTAREHYLCHLLLVRMTEGIANIKMVHALSKMSAIGNKDKYRITSWCYEYVKIQKSRVQTGKKRNPGVTEKILETKKKTGSIRNSGTPEARAKALETRKRNGTMSGWKIDPEKVAIRAASQRQIKRSEEYKEKLRNKKWSQKAIDNRLANCLRAAANRKGTTWDDKKRQANFNTYLRKNSTFAPRIFELHDCGLNILKISKELGISWDRVNKTLNRRADFESFISNKMSNQ